MNTHTMSDEVVTNHAPDGPQFVIAAVTTTEIDEDHCSYDDPDREQTHFTIVEFDEYDDDIAGVPTYSSADAARAAVPQGVYTDWRVFQLVPVDGELQ